jgi:O-antigen ligase
MTASSSPFLMRGLSIVLWVGAFLSSLYFVNEWQLSFYTASIVLLFVWTLVTLGQQVEPGWQIPRSPVLGFAAAFWALIFASVFWSELPLVSLSAFCFFSAMPLTLFVFIMCPDEKRLQVIGYCLAAIMAGLAVWAIIQYCTGYNRFGGQAHHPLADPNALGGFFNLGLIPAIGWTLLARDKKQTGVALALAALIFAGMVATGSRGAFFALIPTLILFLVAGRHFVKGKARAVGLLVLTLLAVFVMSHFLSVEQWNSTSQRIVDTITLAADDVTNNRLNIWAGTIDVIKHYWVHGTGFGTFFLYYPEFRSPDEHIGVSHAHSDPLQYWAELGLGGVVLFYAFLIAAAVRTWKAMAQTKTDDRARILILAPFCALGAVVIQTHVSFNFYNLVILFGAGFLLAVWFTATGRILADRKIDVQFPPRMPAWQRQTFLLLPFMPILFLFGSYMVSEHFVNAARDSLYKRGDLQAFARMLENAHAADHGLNFRTWLLAANIPLGILQEGQNTLSDDQRHELYNQAAGQLARVRALNPRNASALYYQARLQTLGPAEWAQGMPSPEELYKQALKLDPLHLGARMALASLYEERGDEDGMMQVLKDGFDYTYGSTKAMDYYGRIMVMALARGDKELYRQAMDKIVRFRQRMALSLPAGERREAAPVAQDDVLK